MAFLISKLSSLVGANLPILKQKRTQIGDLVLDATITSDITRETKITSSPIQGGSYVTDHSFFLPLTFTVEGSINNAVNNIFTPNADINQIINNVTNIPNRILGLNQRQNLAYEMLREIHAKSIPLTVVCYYDVFENMMIARWNTPRTPDTGDRFYFNLTMQQITFAQVETVNIENNPRPVQDLISKKVNVGKQETTKIDETNSGAKNVKDKIVNYLRGKS